MIVTVIGGGAAGFFAALSCAAANKEARVFLLEKTDKLLAKVRISGGGRCNVTHSCFSIPEMAAHYPRGEKFLRKSFRHFMTTDTIGWFEQRGVPLKTEADGRMFPTTDRSETIIACLMEEARRLGVQIRTKTDVLALAPQTGGGFRLLLRGGENLFSDRVIVTTGGSPKAEGLAWLANLGHRIEPPVPSLFTFNMPAEPVAALAGLSVPKVKAKVAGQKLQAEGPLLFTHWGMSGPAILRLSAWGARTLAEANYRFQVLIGWVPDQTEEALGTHLRQLTRQIPNRQVANRNPFLLPNRLWEYLVEKSGIAAEKTWAHLQAKELNRLTNILLNDSYQVQGKTTFKEEFVTCGGVSTEQVSPDTLESRLIRGLFFAGEVLDIDGITGGFNFQAAWTTGHLAGANAAKKLHVQ